MSGTCNILVVDDDALIRASLAGALAQPGTEVAVASSGEEAIRLIEQFTPHIVLSDVRMAGMSGIELLQLLHDRAGHVDVVLMTAFDDMPTVVSAMRGGACDFLVKPLDLRELRRVLDRIREDRRVRERARRAVEDEAAPYRLDQLVGRDARMISIYKLVGQLAASRATALIRGESGTGKELIARAIHYNSADAGEPFIAINCAALPGGLLESELFGHVRGAFTGAVAARRGRFAAAERGTIFLDEIGDTSLEFQSKLLRVLENGDYQPVGSDRAERMGARVLAATHRDLEHMISEDRFRADLYYRLRVVEVSIPPLRDRREDIPALAQYLVRRASAAVRRAAPILSAKAITELSAREWPGNIRELDNCLTRAVVLATGGVIRPEHLADDPAKPPKRASTDRLGTLLDAEREHIQRVLASVRGHKARAARILGVSRPRLNRLIEKYDLQAPGDAET